MGKGLTRDRVVTAALDVLDDGGIDAVTVRAVAARLDVKVPALYFHVRNKQGKSAPIHRVRAAAALTSFMNALTVSLFALVPEAKLGWAAVVVAIAGLLFVTATLIFLARLRILLSRRIHEAVFLVVLAVVFGFQLVSGVRLAHHPENAEIVGTMAQLVIACFLIGVYRAWDLVGGPSFDVSREVRGLLRSKRS